ncbi:AraC family transcriptional regulator [Leptospira barantonii]|uniref:AraC family transcriptional regulator n=1 Tax=Leptospira barantonii TaxID=2023184 RepID=A0A5F2AXQ9_9LEPT|nr:helix-turn-helix domain-containing protein [Leptospira barantonii]TGL92749.1 AraC family transcriptional regulator [Leptospira barantonii]
MYTFLAFGAGLAALLAISGFLTSFRNRSEDLQNDKNESPESRPKQSRLTIFIQRHTVTLLFLSVAFVQLHIFFELSDRLVRFSRFSEFHIPFIFLIGPLTYLYFQNLSGQIPNRLSPIHLVPAVVSFFILLPFYLRDSNSKKEFITLTNPSDPYHSIILGLLVLGTVLNFIYPITLIKNVWRWRNTTKDKNKRNSFNPFLFLFIGTLFVFVLFVIAQIFYMPLFSVASSGVSVLMCVVFLIGNSTNGIWIEKFKKESREARYTESRLKGVNVDEIVFRLNDLMRSERYYLDEDLTLGRLAEELEIHTHQLSEILNQNLGKTFREYVAGFRLDEAARILIEEPQRSVLSAAYASGFNSKSAFHKLFQERFGCTPTMFRSEAISKNKTEGFS